MPPILQSFYTKPFIICLSWLLIIMSTLAGPAEAMFVPSVPVQQPAQTAGVSAGRAADLEKIQAALELKIVQQRLIDQGLSPDETMARVNKLTDEQVHQLAMHTDSIEAGGGPVGFLVSVMVLALLVVLLIFLLEGRIQIK